MIKSVKWVPSTYSQVMSTHIILAVQIEQILHKTL